MNNLLQSLSNQRLKLQVSDNDLKRLFATVKESRGHDAKLSDTFYDSLEGILMDLRTVTIDNRDAEAFLKPVSRAEYPDYYDVITSPMDLQTMLKKVKSKQYKSKVEFADDLELIWSNCYTYNTGDNHPLRLCVNRLREKANRLLKNVTDRKDRLDPPVPHSISSTPKVNGVMTNGHSRQRSSPPLAKLRPEATPKPAPFTPATPITPPSQRRELPLAEMPAFVRTATGMARFMELDREVESNVAGPSNFVGSLNEQSSNSVSALAEKLSQYVDDRDIEEEFYTAEPINGMLGDKRKLVNGDSRPRKRIRMRPNEHNHWQTDPLDLWWEAATSHDLMANALPVLATSSSRSIEDVDSRQHPPEPAAKSKKRRKKKRPPEEAPKSLLGHINNNIRTLKRVRRTHDKFLALNLNSEDGAGPSGLPLELPEPIDEEDEVDVIVDERPWRSRGTGLEVGEQDSNDCLHWMGVKILEHSGFQSTSKAALDVLTGVAEEYLFNIGRTLRFMCDKYSKKWSAEEIILHALFESGITHVRDLERYITDDVVRYGSRLTELEKKMVNAYREVTAVDAIDDDAFFGNTEDEEEGEFVMGNFSDTVGDDFLGLRAMGIAEEYGLVSLTIPKKLLRQKNARQMADQPGAKPKEPPPPYPPPPSFVPLESTQVEKQIGLLRNFYVQRFNDQASKTYPSAPPPFIQPEARPLSPLSQQLSLEMQLLGQPAPEPPAPVLNTSAPVIVLPDDPLPPSRTKIGPLGQILKPSASASAAKKKAKGKEVASTIPGKSLGGPSGAVDKKPDVVEMNGLPSGLIPFDTPTDSISPSPAGVDSKKKTVAGKKKGNDPLLPPIVTASA